MGLADVIDHVVTEFRAHAPDSRALGPLETRHLVGESLERARHAHRYFMAGESTLHQGLETGDTALLDQAVLYYASGLEGHPPQAHVLLGAIADTLRHRFAFSKQLDDLEQAMRVFDAVLPSLDLTSPVDRDHIDAAAATMDDLYWASGRRLDRLDEAFELRHGLLRHGEGDERSWRYLNNVAATCMARFTRDGRTADVQTAVSLWQRLRAVLPDASEDKPAVLHNLGEALVELAAASMTVEPLGEARAVLEEALRHPAGMSEYLRPRIERSYADALLIEPDTPGDRSERQTRVATACRFAKAALDGASRTGLEVDRAGVTYANALVAAAKGRGDLSLARSACEQYLRAIENIDPGSPNQVPYRCALATTLIWIARATDDADDVARAVAAAHLVWEQGVHGGVVIDRLRFALTYARWAVDCRDYPEAVEALRRGMANLLGVIPGQLNRRDKEAWLAVARVLPVLSAYANVQLGRLRDAAVAVEAGRAVLLAEALADGARRPG